MRLSFRKGGEKGFYSALKEALGRKEWDFASALPAKGVAGAAGAAAGGGGGGIGECCNLSGMNATAATSGIR